MTAVRSLRRIIVCALAFVSYAAGQQAWADHLDQVLTLSGVDAELEQLPMHFKRSLGQGMAGFAPDIGSRIDTAIDEVLDPQAMRVSLRERLDGSLPNRPLSRVLRWYESDLGAKVTMLEIEAGTDHAVEQMSATVDSLTADAELMARARALNEVTEATDQALEMARVTQLAMITGIMAASSGQALLKPAELQRMVEGMIASRKAESDREVLASMAYTYRTLTSDEFDRYLAFLARPDSRKFVALLQQALLAEMEQVTRALGVQIGAVLADAARAADEEPSLSAADGLGTAFVF